MVTAPAAGPPTNQEGAPPVRKIIAGLFISLDGVVEAPETWHFPYFNDEMGEAVAAQAAQSDTMLLGRKTYEAFAAYWPNV
jgi:dihydrofolate reductase